MCRDVDDLSLGQKSFPSILRDFQCVSVHRLVAVEQSVESKTENVHNLPFAGTSVATTVLEQFHNAYLMGHLHPQTD